MNRSPLFVGWALAVLLAVIFAGIAWAALGEGRLPGWDRSLAEEMVDFGNGHPAIRWVMIGFTHAGGIPAMTALATLGVLWQFGHKRFLLGSGWLLIVVGGAALDQGLKVWFDRPRPPPEWRDAVVSETNASFPSGHAMGSVIGYGMLAYSVCLSSYGRRARFGFTIFIAAVVVLIGVSRVFLRAHWCSDVIGGFTIGLAWLAFSLAYMEKWRRRPGLVSAPAPEMARI